MFARVLPYVALALGALGVLVAAGAGCDAGNEGDRCNPDLSHNECNGGLVCTQPDFCPENYCCPTNVTPSDNAYCQPGCAGGAASVCGDFMTGTGPQTTANAAQYCTFNDCLSEGGTPQGCDMAAMSDGGGPAPSEDGSPEASPEAGEDGSSTPEAAPDGPAAETGSADAGGEGG